MVYLILIEALYFNLFKFPEIVYASYFNSTSYNITSIIDGVIIYL